jgi:hypothetical protein
MVVPVNPIVPVVAATQGALPEFVLQPGTTISAQVLDTLADNLVRIAIAGLSIDVATEVALQPGQKLQLAVSQTEVGIRLAIVAPDSAAAATSEAVSLAPRGPVTVSANAPENPGSHADQLSPLERIAVSVAAANAVTQQDSQAPLFANLASLIASGGLPPGLQQAVKQVLAQQTNLDQKLDGADIQLAFHKSGLFLEATLASGSATLASGVPDLKAALIVLRQALVSTLASSEAAPAQAASAELRTVSASAPPASSPTSVVAATIDAPREQRAVIAEIAPPIAPEIESNANLQSLVLPLPDQTPDAGRAGRIVLSEALLNAGGRATTTQAALNLLQEALQQFPRSANNALSANVTLRDGRNEIAAVRANLPPPPFRGALPSAQPIAPSTIAPNSPLNVAAHQLLSDTDAALSRQTLLQVASLPDRVDAALPQADASVPRWNFEIPFMTPQGTAMAQFEIARDGGGNEVEAAKRVWRARFSLDVEPAGPVHALVSLVGERTSVRMWAERPSTAAQLRAGADDLSRALSEAELEPGDIVIRDGTPPQPAPAKAGHFLDRAL